MDECEQQYNAISDLVQRANRFETAKVSQADFPKVQGLVIPTAQFTSLDLYGDNLPTSLLDAFSVKVTIHDSDIDHPKDTTYSITLDVVVDEQNLSKDCIVQVKCALRTAFSACDVDAKSSGAIPPTEALKFVDELDDLLAAFP
jgi:hypothetical protein